MVKEETVKRAKGKFASIEIIKTKLNRDRRTTASEGFLQVV